jgi:hypothetical protein
VSPPRIWELRHNIGAYDAAYIALAEALGCELLTGDVKLKNAAGPRDGHRHPLTGSPRDGRLTKRVRASERPAP